MARPDFKFQQNDNKHTTEWPSADYSADTKRAAPCDYGFHRDGYCSSADHGSGP